jgi:hypothetical protein
VGEVASDGSFVVGKHDGTGGEVSVGTVTSQLLYEIGGPAYLGPDVTARFDTIQVEQVGPDRVRVHGTRGEPPPATLKVAMNEVGGFRNDMAIALTGLDIEAKASLVEEAFWEACPFAPEDFASVTTRVVRTDKPDPSTNEEATALWRITVKDPDERKVGRAVSNAVTELGLATIPGLYGMGSGPGGARSYGVYRPAVVPADLVPQHVVVRGGSRTVVDSVAPRRARRRRRRPRTERAGRRPVRPSGLPSGGSSAPGPATRAATPTSASSPGAMRPGRGSTSSSPSSGSGRCCRRPPRWRWTGTASRRCAP